MERKSKKGLFQVFVQANVSLVQRILPDPFVLTAGLTFIVFLLALILADHSFLGLIQYWYGGFWDILAFSMQMTLILLLGNVVASAPQTKKVLNVLAGAAGTPTQGIVMATVVLMVACWINWGFGLVTGAIFAREIAKRVPGIDYRLLVAGAFNGYVIWHSGLSGSVSLALSSSSLEELTKISNGVITQNIPVSETIFAPFNLIIVGFLFLTIPVLNILMKPDENEVVCVDPAKLDSGLEDRAENQKPRSEMSLAEKLENSRLISLALGLMGLVYVVYFFVTNGPKLGLDILNFTFLSLALLLYKTPIRLVRAVKPAVAHTSGIILQFPFYAGIMGMMTGVGGGGASLAGVISAGFVSISTAATLPVFTFLSAGLVNVFVPSGGGQFVVQGPVIMPAAAELGASIPKTAMAIAWGDAWTNLIQPFWALPVLAIAGLTARDIMGYCFIGLLYSGVVISLGFMFL